MRKHAVFLSPLQRELTLVFWLLGQKKKAACQEETVRKIFQREEGRS